MANEIFGSRIQAPQLRPVGLQPTALPGSTFVRPAQQQAGGNLRALADSLGGLNSALQNYSATVKAQEEDPDSRDNRLWKAKRQTMTYEELTADVKAGTANGIRVREDAQMQLLGEKAASDQRVEMEKFFFGGGFDLATGDPEAAYQEKLAEYADNLPDDFSKAAYYRAMEPHRQQLMANLGKQKVSYMEGQRNTAVVDSFRNVIDDGLAGGKLSAMQIAQSVFARSASNRDFLGLSGDEQNETIYAIAEEYAAKGRPDLVEALLRETRTGADGEVLPAIGNIAKYSTNSIKLAELAKDVRDKKAREDGVATHTLVRDMVAAGTFTAAEAEKLKGKGIFSGTELGGMVSQSNQNRLEAEAKGYLADQKRQNRLNHENAKQGVLSDAVAATKRIGGVSLLKDVDVPSIDGDSTTTYSVADIKKDMVAQMENQWAATQEKLIAGGMTAADARKQVIGEKISWYANAGIVNKQWDSLLNGVASRASIESLLERGVVPAALQEHVEIYRTLKANNPAYLNTVLTDSSSKRFLEAYDRARDIQNADPESALHYAATRSAMTASEEAMSVLKRADTDSIVKSTMSSLGLDLRGPNVIAVYGRVDDMAKAGYTKQEIEDSIKEDLEKHSVVINGSLVTTVRDMPDDFPELMMEEIKTVFDYAKDREGIEDIEDLTVIPVEGSAKFLVVSKSRGYMPLDGGNYITPGHLATRRADRERKREEQLQATAEAAAADRAKNVATLQAELAEDKKEIERWRKKSGPLSRAVAERLEERYQQRVTGTQGFFKDLAKSLQSKIKGSTGEDKKRYEDQMNFYKEMGSTIGGYLPAVTIGDKKLNNGWMVKDAADKAGEVGSQVRKSARETTETVVKTQGSAAGVASKASRTARNALPNTTVGGQKLNDGWDFKDAPPLIGGALPAVTIGDKKLNNGWHFITPKERNRGR